jgi:hypothetical protein
MFKDLAAGNFMGYGPDLGLYVLAHGGSLREFFIGCPGWWLCAILGVAH